MRIAFLSYQWPGLRMGGIGSYVRQCAAALALAGHEPHVFTVGDAGSLPANVPEGVTFHVTADPARRVISGNLSAELTAVISSGGEAVYRLAIAWLLTADFQREHRLQPFDIVEVADVDATGLPLLLGDRTFPVVVHLHTCTAIANRIQKTELSEQGKLIESLEAAQIHLADAICAPTEAVVKETEALDSTADSSWIWRDFISSRRGFLPQRRRDAEKKSGEDGARGHNPSLINFFSVSSSLRLGVSAVKNLSGLQRNRAAAHSRDPRPCSKISHPFVAPQEKFNPPRVDGPVLFVGRLEWRKGCGVLAEALSGFLMRNPSAHFRFIGPDTSSSPDGNSVRLYLLSALDEAVRDRVEFTGELSQPQVAEALAGCCFCVLPSLSENFSLAICEAMAAGRTTVVAQGTGSVEVLGEAGVVVKPGCGESLGAAMDALYRDRARLNHLSRLAFDRVRTVCDPITVSKQRVEFYQHAIDAFNARPERLATLPAGVAAAVLPCMVRMTAALMRVDESTDSPGSRLNAIFEKLNEGKPAEVLLFGAGKHTARLLSERHRWERNGHRVVGLIDDHPRFAASPIYLGLPVRSLMNTGIGLPVVLSTDTYEQQFWEQTKLLRDNGVHVFKLYGV